MQHFPILEWWGSYQTQRIPTVDTPLQHHCCPKHHHTQCPTRYHGRLQHVLVNCYPHWPSEYLLQYILENEKFKHISMWSNIALICILTHWTGSTSHTSILWVLTVMGTNCISRAVYQPGLCSNTLDIIKPDRSSSSTKSSKWNGSCTWLKMEV